MELWKELREAYVQTDPRNTSESNWQVVADRARTLLAAAIRDLQQQVPPLPCGQGWQVLAHRKNTDEWMYVNHAKEWHLFPGPCPPPAPLPPICGMSVEDWQKEFERGLTFSISHRKYIYTDDAARVAHRLAQPAPVVDPDAEAKRIHLLGCGDDCEYRKWEQLTPDEKMYCRRIAAERSAGNEYPIHC